MEVHERLPSSEYAQLTSDAYGLIAVFSDTYLCEKPVSKMKYVEPHYR